MSTLHVRYDGDQHCTASLEPQGKITAMDCPYTGKGEEFSPANMVGAGLAACMLLSMGTLALRDGLDLSGTCVEVEVSSADKPIPRIGSIALTFNMPRPFSDVERLKLERAAGTCPIKRSFHAEITISSRYNYPGAT